ncbi:30S ribosomal subunit protein S6 [Candidatus Hodgkinia cicadicola]|nr:30S ribosomal subunit protein S6 [Candidatus Hodgkinia cicadicola]
MLKAKVCELVMRLKRNVTRAEAEVVSASLEKLLTGLGAYWAQAHNTSLAYKIRALNNAFGLRSSFSLGARECALLLRRSVCVRFKPLRFGVFAAACQG